MADMNIEYGELGFDTFKREILNELGGNIWNVLTSGGIVPIIDTEQ